VMVSILNALPTSKEIVMADEKDQFSEMVLEERAYDDLSRREIRSLIFHLLYAADSFDYQESLQSIVASFNCGFKLSIPLESEMIKTVQAVIDERAELDEKITPFLLNWRIDRIGLATKLILRFAFWELDRDVTPPRVILNEAIELAKCFAEKDAFKFVNGVLDEVCKARDLDTE